MKIRTQFILSMIILGSLLLAVGAAVVMTDQKVKATSQLEVLAAQVENEAYELSYLTNDYLLYRESLQAKRWASKFASFSNDLAAMQVSAAGQQALLTDIKANQQKLTAIFTEIKARIESAPQAQESSFDTTFMQVSWSRLEVQNQAIIFDASRLRQMLSEQDDELRRGMNLISFLLFGVIGVMLLVNYGLIFQRTLKALAGLQAGTRMIGSGKLDFAIPVKRQDEIGELSQAFNRMATNLKQVTASKEDLEKEIVERKQAEAALRASEGRLEALYDSMTEGIANHTIIYEDQKAVDYTITDVNLAFERITGIPRSEAIGRTASVVYQSAEPPYLEIYTRVAESGCPETFETKFDPMDKYFSISVFSPEKGKFATVFSDITERKQAEAEIQRHIEALGSANAELSQFNRAMVGRELRMIELKKEVDELCKQAGKVMRYSQSNGGEAA